jgi:hypothetical protein
MFLSKPKYGKGRKRLTEDEAFVVRHFAGEVLYETHRFLDKNNDTIHDELIDVLAESSLPFVQGAAKTLNFIWFCWFLTCRRVGDSPLPESRRQGGGAVWRHGRALQVCRPKVSVATELVLVL